jgi:sensor histidine kinase regulating citrate/malate metabolism
MEKAVSFSDTIVQNTPNGIMVVSEDMEVQRINDSARRLLRIREPEDILCKSVTLVLPPDDFRQVLSTGENIYRHRYYLAEYGLYVEQTILYDREYHIIIVILRDMTAEESQREKREKISQQTIETADKVIEKQMRAVQEIASVLGETTAN